MEYAQAVKKAMTKVVPDYENLTRVIEALRVLGNKIVCTIGSWDMYHIGHARYLMKARECGDILVVGADSDRAIKIYKGEFRPRIPQEERMELLSYQSCIDFVTIVDDVNDQGWQYGLIKKIRPDVFVAVEDSYPQRQQEEIKLHCKELVVLPRQAQTSTSDVIRGTFNEIIDVIQNFAKRA